MALSDVEGLAPVQLKFLHLTLQGLAFQDEVDEVDIARLGEVLARRTRSTTLLPLEVSRARMDVDAVSLPVAPRFQLLQLRDLIAATAKEVLQRADLYHLPEPISGFRPHVTVAYAHGPVPGEQLVPRLDSVEHETLSLDVRHVSLIALSREYHRWEWEHEVPIPLGGNQGSAVQSRGGC